VSPIAERRLLQLTIAAASLVPLTMGSLSLWQSATILKGVAAPLSADLDSHFRYLSGLLLGVGLVFLALIPRIERHGSAVRALAAIVVVGGVGRLVSFLELGAPSNGHILGLGMELIVVPLIALWQARVARRWQKAAPG
jgi:hypothetical protein